VRELADKAKRFAEGDISVSIKTQSEDEIGVLGRTFNYMVECVTEAKTTLQQEIKRKSALLEEEPGSSFFWKEPTASSGPRPVEVDFPGQYVP